MSRETILLRGRAVVEPSFMDACTVQRVIGQQTNLVTAEVTDTLQPIYTGRCRVQQASAPWAGPATRGQAQIGMAALTLHLPVEGSEGITKDDIVTVTASRNDTELVGRRFTIQGEHHASEKTARRLPLLEIIG